MALAKSTRDMYKRSMKQNRSLRSYEDIEAAHGGPRKLAAWAGISWQGVCNWKRQVPPGYHYKMHLWAQSKGLEIAPEAFGLMADGKAIPEKPKRKRAA